MRENRFAVSFLIGVYMNHGILELVLKDINEYPRPVHKETICRIGPSYTDEELSAFDELWHWLKVGRGLYIGVNWYPNPADIKIAKKLTDQEKYKRAVTKARNRIKKKFPLFWEDIFIEQLEVLKIRYKQT